jgi:hypothetical protein
VDVRRRVEQPILGIVASCVIVLLSLAFISLFDWPTFGGWVAYSLMCAIPATIVAGVTAVREVAALKSLRQPIQGCVLLVGAAVVAVIVGVVHFLTVGGGVSPLLPMASQCVTVSIPVTFWMSIVLGGWPFILIRSRLGAAASLLVGCYIVNYIIFENFFNYKFFRLSPSYRLDLDPHGLLDGWDATTAAVTCVGVMFLMLHFEIWPLTRAPVLMKQPMLGLVWTTAILVVGTCVFDMGTTFLRMASADFLIKAPVPFIFGSIIVLNMTHGTAFAGFGQPRRGALSAALAAAVGLLLSAGYSSLAPVLTATLAAGPPTYDAEVWLVSALLAVTFPFLGFYDEFFRMWPLAVSDNGHRPGSEHGT